MQRDTIVYFGIIQHEYNNAMCRHSIGIKKLIEKLGYRAIIIGVSKNVSKGTFRTIKENTFAVREPNNIWEKIKECISSEDIERVLKHIGTQRIESIIMADFRYLPMKRIDKLCERNSIKFVVDIMDYFVFDSGIVSRLKKIDCDLRMKYFYPRVPRRIYICSSYNELIGSGIHTAVIPGVTWDKHLHRPEGKNKIVLTFLGRPGIRCEKERIDWVIRAINELNVKERFIVLLGGFDKSEFVENNPGLRQYISDNIHFLGRISAEECLKVLDESDFSLVIRPNNKLSKYGLSTKIGESFSRSIPVLTTDTSDNKKYVIDGKSGYVCDCSYDAVKEVILKIANAKHADIVTMKKYIYDNNPLDYYNYIDEFKKAVLTN